MKTNQIARPRLVFAPLALAAAALVSACGGGDPHAGLWEGSLDENREVSTIVLGDGTYYMLYSAPGQPSSVAGIIQGTGDFHGARFTSEDALNYNWEGLSTRRTEVSAKIGAKMSASGSVGGSGPLSISYVHEFDGLPDLSNLVGSFAGNATFALGVRPGVFTVTPAGDVSTRINDCPITGKIAPRADANAYDLNLTFGGYPCVFPYAQFSGVAIYRDESRQIQAAVTNPMYGHAIAFGGTRQ
jgi:hypothetical protein